MQLTTRNATLADLAELLKDHHARRHDVVVPAAKLHASNGLLRIEGAEPTLSMEGVTSADGYYRPTALADEGVADKLGVPVVYLRKLREQRPDLYDANVNGWLHGGTWAEPHDQQVAEPDPRKFLVRCLQGDGGTDPGVARAFLSDGYRIIDNLDVLTAALEGVRATDADAQVVGCDLTERRMVVRVASPSVAMLAPELLAGYRNPFDGGAERIGGGGWGQDHSLWNPTPEVAARWRDIAAREGQGYEPGREPVVFAGFVLTNSETGGGAFTITPRLVVRICKNGLTMTKDALREVHLGARLDEGVVRWSEETQERTLQLVASKARDAVATFLDTDYMAKVLARIEAEAGKPMANPAEQVATIGRTLRFSQDRIDGVLDHFIKGGQPTAGGVLNAVTSYAQTLADADAAYEVEGKAMAAFDLAVAAK